MKCERGFIRSDQHRIIGLDALWDLIVQNPNYSASLHNRQLIDVLVNSQKEDARQASALKKERIRFHEKEKRQEVIAAGHQSLTPKKNDPSCLMDGESKETNPPNHRFVRCSQTSSSEAITFLRRRNQHRNAKNKRRHSGLHQSYGIDRESRQA